ncbi:MAG: HEAT repeat domain-containing protein [Cyanobacteria bacterium P01_D01_bin.1]
MSDFLTVAAGLKAGEWLVKDFLGPAAKDFCQDFLKQKVTDGLARNAPEPLQRAIAQSVKFFLDVFQNELENCGLPAALIHHEFREPVKRFINDSAVISALGEAFDTDTQELDEKFFQDRWLAVGNEPMPEAFRWQEAIANYTRRVKGLIKYDEDLNRALLADHQEKISANTSELLGVAVPFELRQHQESLKEKFGALSLDSLDTTGAAYDNLRLWKVFVAQDVRECAEFAPQMYEMPRERLLELQAAGEIDPLLSVDVLEQQRRSYAEKPIESVRGVVGLTQESSVLRSVILGDPGSGKSTLLRAMALSWAEKPMAALKDQPVPILIELRLYAQDKEKGICNSFLEYLHKGNTACRLNQIEVDALLKSGKAVALFDGIDEVFDSKLREAVKTDIHRFSNRYAAVQIVVTSRWLGYRAEALRKAEFQHYMLQDLNEEQIEDFLEKWHELTFTETQAEERERKQARLQEAVTESKAIRELAGNPLLLTTMAILNRDLQQELPRNRARLYEGASEVLLHQWDVEGKLYERAELKDWQIDVRDKQAMLRKVAHHMQANEEGLSGNVISQEDLEQILTDYLKIREVERARTVAKVMIQQLRERNFILCYLGADNYAFVHRTFLEYFCASEFAYQFNERKLDNEGLKALYGEHFHDESWDEVLRLIAGMVEPRFVGEIIEYLLEQRVDFVEHLEPEYFPVCPVGDIEWLKATGLSNLFLAADCLSEVRTCNEVLPTSILLLDKLKQVVKTEYPYPLTNESARMLVEVVAQNWKDDPETLIWLKDCMSWDHYSYIPGAALRSIIQSWKDDIHTLPTLKSRAQNSGGEDIRSAIVTEIAKGWKDDSDTLPWLKSVARDNDSWYVKHTAVSEIAEGWKDDPDTLPWLKFLARDVGSEDVRGAAITEIAEGWKDDPETLPMLKTFALSGDVDVRSAAITELAKGWKSDSDTLSTLKACASNDSDGTMRYTAVFALARGWKDDPDTLPWLKARAQDDDQGDVRSAAVTEIAKGWKDDPDTLPWLKARAQNDEQGDVRSAAVAELAKRWKNDPDTLPIVKICAQNDTDGDVRRTAIAELARGWKNDPDTLPIVKICAQNDTDGDVRRAAIAELTRGWKNDPDTLPIVKICAQNDTDGDVQCAAISKLARIWKSDIDTLLILKYLAQNSTGDVRSEAIFELTQGWKDDSTLLDFWCDRTLQAPFKRQYDWQDNPRQIALDGLVKQYPNHPKTKELLRDRAQNDNDEQFRTWAAKQLTRLES